MAAKKTAEFMLVNRRSKKALQATGQENGLVVEQAAPTGSDAQLWTAVEAGGAVKLVNKLSGKVLDIMAEGSENGAWAQTWEDVDGGSQMWQLVTVTSTYKKLLNVRSGKVLDIVDMSDEDGAPAQLWEDVNGLGQQWRLVSAEKPAKKAKKPVAKKAPSKTAVAKKPTASKKEPAPKAVQKAAAEAMNALKKEPEKKIAKVEEKPKTMTKTVSGTAAKKPAAKAAEKKPAAKTTEKK